MATRDKPEAWLDLLQNHPIDDLKLAGFVLRDLVHYVNGQRFEQEDTAKLLALFTGIRMHQMAKDFQEMEAQKKAAAENS